MQPVLSLPPDLSLLMPLGEIGHGYACTFSLELTESVDRRWRVQDGGAEWEKLVGNITKTVEEAALVAQDADSSDVGR